MNKNGDKVYTISQGKRERLFGRKSDLSSHLRYYRNEKDDTSVVRVYELVLLNELSVLEYNANTMFMYLYKYNGVNYLVNAFSDSDSKRVLNERILFYTGKSLTPTELERLEYVEKEVVTEG